MKRKTPTKKSRGNSIRREGGNKKIRGRKRKRDRSTTVVAVEGIGLGGGGRRKRRKGNR